MHVIQADYGVASKVIGVLNDSTDVVEWTNEWFKANVTGVIERPIFIRAVEFESLDTPIELGAEMQYVVEYENFVGRIQHVNAS